jgi:hypothetical protein
MKLRKPIFIGLLFIFFTGSSTYLYGQEKELTGNTWTFSKYFNDLKKGDTLTLYLAYEYGEFAFLIGGELDSCSSDTYCVRKNKELTQMVKTCKWINTGWWSLKDKQLTIAINDKELVFKYLENTTNTYTFIVMNRNPVMRW